MPFNPLRDIYYVFDKPIPYKNLLIYPAMMEQYLEFHSYALCLLLEKNSVPDVRIISMSYLEYMYDVSTEDENYIAAFRELMKLVLRKPDINFTIGYIENKPHFQIDNEIYDASDFDALREIISEQNLFELPNELIQKDIRDKQKEAKRLREKINNTKMASLEDQIIAVAIYTGWGLENIYQLTIRKFIKTLERADHMLHSQIYLQASMSGFVEFKDKSIVKHWLSEISKENIGEIVDLENVQNKVNLNNAK